MLKACAALVVAAAGTATAASDSSLAPNGAPAIDFGSVPASVAAPADRDVRLIARAMLPLMPEEQRRAIIEGGGVGSEGYDAVGDRTGELLVSHDERYAKLRHAVSPALFARLKPEHLDALLLSVSRAENRETPIAMCFAPGTDPELMAAFNILFQDEFLNGEGNDPRFQIGDRWSSTASNFGTGPQGDPIVLTYSFAPDGSLADNLSGSNRVSQLFNWLNGIYGSPATWQSLFATAFNNWSNYTGVTYIHEPNDDGREANTSGGALGIRGDVRIFAVPLDGNFNVLAYNAFPNQGDMVFDAFDSFFNSTSQGSRRLRNVAGHEHGHGLGFNHVCPQNGTKLMEPSANTNFNGIQLDDILAGQRNYGDQLEPNDSAGEATPLGAFSIGTSQVKEQISIDDNSDVDFFSFSTTQPLEIVVTVTPAGDQYFQGPQNFNGSCSSGSLTNYNNNQDLSIAIRASNGTTELIEVNDAPAGSVEELRYTISTPGNYYIVVDDPGFANSIQPYDIAVSGAPVPFDGPTIELLDEIPLAVAPSSPLSLTFDVDANADTIIDGPDLHYRFDNGAFTSVPLAPLGGGLYEATIPAASCDDSPEFYIAVTGSIVGEVNLPLAGAADPFTYAVGSLGIVFEDDFESANGWVDNLSTASSGMWERGVPVSSPGAPENDFDGSGQCYLTGNSPGEDVDFGRVFLRAPAVNLEDGGVFSYAYWLSAAGAPLNGDSMTLEMSTNGQITWTTVRTYTSATDGWATDSVEIDAATGVSSTYFRFIVEDQGADNILEAAIDAVTVGTVTCDDSPTGCNLADVAAPFGVLDLADIGAFVNAFSSQDPLADIAAPFGVFDLADLGLFTSEFLAGCP